MATTENLAEGPHFAHRHNARAAKVGSADTPKPPYQSRGVHDDGKGCGQRGGADVPCPVLPERLERQTAAAPEPARQQTASGGLIFCCTRQVVDLACYSQN